MTILISNPIVCLFVGVALAYLGSAPVIAGGYLPVEEHTQIVFGPDRTVVSLIHDWVFDPITSESLKDAFLKPGVAATRENFAEHTKEDTKALADVHYYTKLTIDGTIVEFAPVIDYWMEERPDHRLVYHCSLPLRTPERISDRAILIVDGSDWLDFKIDEGSLILSAAPPECTSSLERPNPPPEVTDKAAYAEWLASGGWAPRIIIACK